MFTDYIQPTCKKCPIHCYKPDMREKMRAVMRWAGPRMMLYHPIEAIKHLIREKIGNVFSKGKIIK